MKKKFFSLLFSLLTATSCATSFSAGAAETNDNIQDDIKYIQQVQSDDITLYYDENGRKIDIAELNNDIDVNENSLPSSYDLRDYKRVTPVRNQGVQGLCWDFAATASIESNILSQPELSAQAVDNPSVNLDLSEGGNSWYIHTNIEDESSILYNDFINDPQKGTNGGFTYYVADGLSAGYGTYSENLMPYEQYDSGYSEALRFYSDYRLKDYSELTNDTALIKKKLMDNGAVTVHYNCFNANTYMGDGMQSYYDDGTSIDGLSEQTHIVAIVGWDDNYSKENFNPLMQPQNDGAWLCKNSWGEDSCSTAEGYEGYFWMSYDTFLYSISQFIMQSTDEYDKTYQYQVTSEYSLNTTSAANIFTAKSNEVLKQISFSANGASDVSVEIYKLNNNFNSPVDGKLISSFEASADFTGTHNINCPEGITLDAGDIFSVVINQKSQLQLKFGENKINEKDGLSYYCTDNGEWFDVCNNSLVGYASIKAFTSNMDGTDKTELESLVKTAQSTEPDADINSELIEEFNLQIKASQDILNDVNASQNDADNAYCLLSNSLEKITNYSFTISSVDDYYTLYNKIENQRNNNIKKIILNTDIDFGGRTVAPIFTQTAFSGIFEGNGHTMSNFSIKPATALSAGLFGSLNGATIKNITFSGCEVISENFASVISSDCINSVISNCNVENSKIKSKIHSAALCVSPSDCTIEDCSVTNTKVYGNYTAGVFYCGNFYNTTVNNCTSSEIEIYSFVSVSDNSSTVILLNTNIDYNYSPILKLDDNDCTIENFIGKISSAESENASVTLLGDKYLIENTSGENYVVLSYEPIAEKNYLVSGDIETRELLLNSYIGSDTDIVIPSQITGNSIVGFSDDFWLPNYIRDNIKTITFPETMSAIPDDIFNNMSSLESITLEDGIKSIGNFAFGECQNLSSVILPDSLISIGASAFSLCNNLNNIKFGNGLEFIGNHAFANCISITDPILPDSIKIIDNYAFANCAFMSVTIGKNIEQIGENAFGSTGATELDFKSVFIPDFVINGYSSTVSEKYAEEYGLRFIDIETQSPERKGEMFDYGVFIKGDVNLDGKVTIDDATLISKWLADCAELNQIQLCNAIVCDKLSTIDIDSATDIQKYIAGIIDNLYYTYAG